MMDKEYQARFSSGIIELMMTTGMTETNGQRVAYMPAGEIIDTFVTVMGLLLRDSEGTATPARTRQTCDEIARKLQRRVNEAKRADSPFTTMPMGPAH
jgi:hypothetical protein